MNKFILGKKIGMTQLFTEEGNVVPVTVIEAGPCTVVQKRTTDNDGYTALKIGYAEANERRMNKPDKGLFQKAKVAPKKFLREFRTEDVEKYEVGQEIKVAEMFQVGDSIDVTGTSKGKGFQGNIKRHGQSGGKETHGSMYHRRVGSMGGCSDPSRVFKGKKLPGHMGMERVTVQNLDVIKVDEERNLLLVKGAVPGPKGGLLMVKESVKVSK